MEMIHVNFLKEQKWDLSTSSCGSKIQVSLPWWTAGSLLTQWTLQRACFSQLHLQANTKEQMNSF